MNRIRKLLAFILAGALLFQLAACAAKEPEIASEEAVSSESEPESSEEQSEPEPEEKSEPEPSRADEPSEPEPASEGSGSADSETDDPEFAPVAYTGASTGTRLNPDDITLYAFRNGFMVNDYTEESGYEPKFASLINANTGTVEPNPGLDPNEQSEADFLVIGPNYEKYIYSLKSGFLLVGDTAYRIGAGDYAGLKAIYEDSRNQCGTYPQWLVYMNPSRVTGARCLTNLRNEITAVSGDALGALVGALRAYPVVSGDTSPVSGRTVTPGNTAFQVWLDFDGGTGREGDLYYTVTFEGNSLYVESSDLAYSCAYEVRSNGNSKRIKELVEYGPAPQESAINPETAKPVIYLYPEKATDITVKLDFQGELGYTFPAYRDGWSVLARPDGTLTDKADGSTHYYLFWDGVPDKKSWDFSKGFVVKGGEVEAFFREKLPAMGLIPREYNDFITYWVPEMRKNTYNLITFSTTEYKQVAPLNVSPAPDTVLRVHMVYLPLSESIAIEEQALPAAPERKGFTLVEWGGTRVQ